MKVGGGRKLHEGGGNEPNFDSIFGGIEATGQDNINVISINAINPRKESLLLFVFFLFYVFFSLALS